MTTLYGGGKPDTDGVMAEASDEERMRKLIDTLSAYIEHYHGGRVDLVSFDGSVLQVRMRGNCRGCDLAPVTLHGWIEGTVRPFFPNLLRVEAV